MNFIRRIFRRESGIVTKDFRKADIWEINQTPFQVDAENSIFWTPIFNKRKASPELLTYIQDCGYYQEYDIHNQNFSETHIHEMISAMVDAAFDQKEFFNPNFSEASKEQDLNSNQENNFETSSIGENFIKIQNSTYFPATQKTSLHGEIDFLIHNTLSNEYLMILCPNKINHYSLETGYSNPSNFSAACIFWYFVINYSFQQNLKVICTNAHTWQLFELHPETGFCKTKKLKSKNKPFFENQEFIESALGMIRFAAGVKSDGQIMMEDLYEFYDEQMFLSDTSVIDPNKKNIQTVKSIDSKN